MTGSGLVTVVDDYLDVWMFGVTSWVNACLDILGLVSLVDDELGDFLGEWLTGLVSV